MRVESDYINRPIVPITDEWLGDDKRRWEEIDEALELRVAGRRMAIQVEAMCRVNTARLMAYAQLYGEYESLRQGYAAKEAMERSKYDQEKGAIATGNLAKNDRKKQVRESWLAH